MDCAQSAFPINFRSECSLLYYIEKKPWMELIQEKFRAEENYVVDSIETDGAEMFLTKTYEPGVSGRDIKCAGHRWAMIGPSRRHAQYFGEIPRGLLKRRYLIILQSIVSGIGTQTNRFHFILLMDGLHSRV